jgi:hypothetical protein
VSFGARADRAEIDVGPAFIPDHAASIFLKADIPEIENRVIKLGWELNTRLKITDLWDVTLIHSGISLATFRRNALPPSSLIRP